MFACFSPNSRKKNQKQQKDRKQKKNTVTEMDPSERFPLLDLSSSLLFQVLRRLPARDVLNLSESCHYLHQLSQHNYVWRKLAQAMWGTTTSDLVMKPNRWKHYYTQRHVVLKEGVFEWDSTKPAGEVVSKRYQHSGSVVGDDIYYIGGQELPDRRFDDIYVLRTESNQIEKVTVTGSMPKFARHTAVAVGKKIFLFGGFDGVSQHFHLSVFDTITNAWNNPYVGGECPPSRTNHAATCIDDKMYLFGGMFKDPRDRLIFLDDLYVLDTTSLTWSKLPQKGDKPSPRCGHRMLALNGMLILFGGGSGEQWDKKFSDIHIYNPATHTWLKPKLKGAAPVCTFTVAFTAGGFFFVFGGQSLNDNNLTNDLYCLDLTSMEWIKITALNTYPGARDMASGNVVGNNMYMFGGYCGTAIDSFHTLKINKKIVEIENSPLSLSPVA